MNIKFAKNVCHGDLVVKWGNIYCKATSKRNKIAGVANIAHTKEWIVYNFCGHRIIVKAFFPSGLLVRGEVEIKTTVKE